MIKLRVMYYRAATLLTLFRIGGGGEGWSKGGRGTIPDFPLDEVYTNQIGGGGGGGGGWSRGGRGTIPDFPL